MAYQRKYLQLIEEIESINIYKYAAYRMALKMCKVQRACKFHLADLNILSSVFLGKMYSDDILKTITLEHVENILNSLYEKIRKIQGSSFFEDISALLEISVCFISRVFCREENMSVYMYELKFILALLCTASLGDKHKYIFNIFSAGGCITEELLCLMLKCYAKTAEALGERMSFGSQYLRISVRNCLNFGQMQREISERKFMDWLSLEPQTLVFLSTFHRQTVSEKNEHRVKCDICRTFPIRGLRYKCLYCVNYNSCQECFLRGFFSRSHEMKHPIQEMCFPVSYWKQAKTFIVIAQNRLCFGNRRKKNFLMFEEDCHKNHSVNSTATSPSENRNKAGSVSLVKDLSVLMEKLEESNRCVNDEIKSLQEKIEALGYLSQPDETYRNWVQQIQQTVCKNSQSLQFQLLQLKELLQSRPNSVQVKPAFTESTVFSPNTQLSISNAGAYLESTPLAAMNGNALLQSPQNLRKFIKHRAKMDGFANLSKTVAISKPVSSLYSLADIEMENLSSGINASYENIKDMSETIAAGNVMTYIDEHVSNAVLDCVSTADSSGFNSKTSSVHNSDLSEQSSVAISMQAPVKSDSSISQDSNARSLCLSTFSGQGFEDGKENVEVELQQVLEQLESLYPKVADMQQSIPAQKDKFLSALSEMEEALRRLSTSAVDEKLSAYYLEQ